MTLPAKTDPRSAIGDGWRPSARDRARFGRAGKRYLDDLVNRFDIAFSEVSTVFEVAGHHDAIARLVLLQRQAKALREQIQLERLILEYRKRVDSLEQRLMNGEADAIEANRGT